MNARQTAPPIQFRSADTVPRLITALNTDETAALDRAAQEEQQHAEAHNARQNLDRLLARRQELDGQIAIAEQEWREKTAAAEQLHEVAVAAEHLAADTRELIELVAPGTLNGHTPQAPGLAVKEH